MMVHLIDKRKRIKNTSYISPKFNFLQFCPVLPSFTQFYPVLPSFAQFYPVLPSFAEFFFQFHRVSPRFAQCCPVFLNFYQFCPVLPGFSQVFSVFRFCSDFLPFFLSYILFMRFMYLTVPITQALPTSTNLVN